TTRGHGVLWVIEKAVWRLQTWSLRTEHPIALEAIGLPTAVQVIARILRARQRPFLLFSPDVCAHDEQPYRRILAHTVVEPLEPVVIPAQLHTLKINSKRLRHDAERHGTTDATQGQAVLPGANHQALVTLGVWGLPIAAHTQVVANGAAQEDVIPPAHVQGWNCHLVVLHLDAPLLPVGVIGGMLQPIV